MEENTPKLYKLQVTVDQITFDKLNQLSERFGTIDMHGKMNQTYTVRTMIHTLHKKEFPDYIQVARQRPNPVDKATAQFEAQERRDQLKATKERQGYESICNMLDRSTIIDHPLTGKPACQYPMFMAVSPHKIDERTVTEELDTLTKETPLLQYRGLLGETGIEGKESVMKILAKQAKLNK